MIEKVDVGICRDVRKKGRGRSIGFRRKPMKAFGKRIKAGYENETSPRLWDAETGNTKYVVLHMIAKSLEVCGNHIHEWFATFGFPHRSKIQDILNKNEFGSLGFRQPNDFLEQKIPLIVLLAVPTEGETLAWESRKQDIRVR